MFENLLDIPETRLGVFVSGGTDSTLLLYLLLRENLIEGRGKQFVLFNVPKVDGSALYTPNVVEKTAALVGVPAPMLMTVGNPNLFHGAIVQRAWEEVARRKIVEKIFIADNIIPPDVLDGLAPSRGRASNPILTQPFFELTKDQLIQAFYDLGIESLLVHTHTCTELTDGECGECWQCNERAWAFHQVGRKDPLRV